ncbi:hypothetical protein CONPUDRAFT_145715 [Coniophora puteana RWD-64-598 SS2]|uniref:Uncharacterized protein n=1 Tax=Coniophora puteana (strain RWD-64-598) TaxID=741705 RepID=A0A5M3MH03_CONPW|nr:uncharacterized protein CONPUDRAFT_145715 [Coniophora puteana RWD-64-598 SS2]EIW78509.1 hypothetical protein CONPUDRAFT_145715 [Coniophora puteana RWD-64-598 SS2]
MLSSVAAGFRPLACSTPGRLVLIHVQTRTYAAQKSARPTASPKGNPHPPHPPSTPKTTSTTKPRPAKVTSATESAAKQKLNTNAKPAAASASGSAANAKPTKSKEQIGIERMEKTLRSEHLMNTTDFWGLRSPQVLDVEARMEYAPVWSSPSSLASNLGFNTSNAIKSAFSIYAIAQQNAFPGGVTVPSPFGVSKLFNPSNWRQFGPRGWNSENGWLSPLRQVALDLHSQMWTSYADNGIRELRYSTTVEAHAKLARTLKARDPAHIYAWQRHTTPDAPSTASSSDSPSDTPGVRPPSATILSVRATEGNHATSDPRLGNRLLVHALVKIESSQSLQIYNRRGILIGKSGLPSSSSSSASKNKNKNKNKESDVWTAGSANIFASVRPTQVMSGPADAKPVPVRVAEYWILEKVGWYDEGWRIRDAYGKTEESLQVKA